MDVHDDGASDQHLAWPQARRQCVLLPMQSPQATTGRLIAANARQFVGTFSRVRGHVSARGKFRAGHGTWSGHTHGSTASVTSHTSSVSGNPTFT